MPNESPPPQQHDSAIATGQSFILAPAGPNVDLQWISKLLIAGGMRPDEAAGGRTGDGSEPGRFSVLRDLGSVPEALADCPADHLLLIYENPVADLAGRLGSQTPEEAVQGVADRIGDLLTTYRTYRARCTLIDLARAQSDSRAAVQALNARLGMSLRSPRSLATVVAPADSPLTLIADYLIGRDPDLRLAVAELEAGTLPMAKLELAPATALLRLIETPSRSEQRAENPDGEGLLSLQLKQALEELEHYHRQNKALREKTELLSNRASASEFESARLQSELQTKAEELTELNHQLQETAQALEDVFNSKSWKWTRPLRAILGLFG